MKNITKSIGIIVLITMITFFIIACGNPSSSSPIEPRGQGLYLGNSQIPINLSGQAGNNIVERSVSYVNANGGENYTLILGENVQNVEPQTLDQDSTTLIITSDGNNERKISLGSKGSLFTIGGTFGNPHSAKLVIDGFIILEGIADNNNSLVSVIFGGSLDLKGNSKLIGNTTTAGGGGIIISGGSGIGEGATATMSGNAEISGNEATSFLVSGGGVVVQNIATFTISGNAIIKNNKSITGGGVNIVGGLVIMNGGTITSNIVTDTGGGVHIQAGTFTVANEQILTGIHDNTAGGEGSHVYLFLLNNPTFTVGGLPKSSY